MTTKISKKDRNSESLEEETPPVNTTNGDRGNVLTCILPRTGRKLKLSIIIKKNPKPKLKKIASSFSIEKEKEKEKEKVKNPSLLDALLQVVEQYKTDEDNKRE